MRRGDRQHAGGQQTGRRFRKRRDLRHLGVKGIDDGLWQSRGSPDAEPQRHVGIGIAGLGERRRIGEIRAAGAMIDAEHVELAGLGGWIVGRIVRDLNGSSEEVIQDVGAAAIGHVQKIDAGPMRQHLHAHMATGARPGCAERQLAGIGPGIVDELLHRFQAGVRMYAKAGYAIADTHDGMERFRIIGHLAQERQVDGRRVRGEQQRVAVGRGFGHGFRADHAGGAAPVLDHELLAEGLAELLGPVPGEAVGSPACTKRNDDFHRFVRPGRLCTDYGGKG